MEHKNQKQHKINKTEQIMSLQNKWIMKQMV